MPKVGDFLMGVFPNFRNSCISEAVIDTYRRTCSKIFYKETIQKNFTKFRGKHLSWSLSLSKLLSYFIKKTLLCYKCFPVNFAKNFWKSLQHLWYSTLPKYCPRNFVDFQNNIFLRWKQLLAENTSVETGSSVKDSTMFPQFKCASCISIFLTTYMRK